MLKVTKITKTFNGLFRPVLNEIDLCLSQSDFCILIGANGCGKSTLLKLISGEYKADSGTVERNDVAMVVQDVNQGTIPEMTLLENIALSEIKRPKLLFYSRYTKQVKRKLQELNIGLEQYINQPLKVLSGGQKQIIATLMAVNAGKNVLLLDEHTSALDPKMQNLLMQYTAQKIKEFGMTTLMTTHNMHDALKYGNRLIMLHQGQIVLDVSNHAKRALTIQNLLALFHKYEDQTLTAH